MNQEQLQAMRERVNKATPGPWRFDIDDRDVWCRIDGGTFPIIMTIAKEPEDEDRCLDFDFIAHAREDLPNALDHIEHLTDDLHAETEKSFWQAKEIERLRGALEYISSFEKVTLLACDINVNELGEVARQALAGEST